MYFVTSKRKGYSLFSMTPSERAAIGLTEGQDRVHLLERVGADWQVRQEWPISERSHTDIMVRLGAVDEPATVDELLRLASAR